MIVICRYCPKYRLFCARYLSMMIIANLLGRTKLALLDNTEAAAWEASEPLNDDLIYNVDTKSFMRYDGTAGAVEDIGAPVTTWKIDDTAPASGSYVTYPATINKVVLIFMLNGTPYRVVYYPASSTNEVYHKVETGEFELYIAATPAVQFNSEWLSIIYNNDIPFIPV